MTRKDRLKPHTVPRGVAQFLAPLLGHSLSHRHCTDTTRLPRETEKKTEIWSCTRNWVNCVECMLNFMCAFAFTLQLCTVMKFKIIFSQSVKAGQRASLYLCDDNVAVGSVAAGDHVIQEVLGDLSGLPAAGAPSYDDHLVALHRRHNGLRLGGDGEALPILQTLGQKVKH